jgi:hypothetical protein
MGKAVLRTPEIRRTYPSSVVFFILILNLACIFQAISSFAQWASIGPGGGQALSLASAYVTQWHIYAGTAGGGVFKSTDGGL